MTSVRAISASGALVSRRGGGAPLPDSDAPSRSQALVCVAPIEMPDRTASTSSRRPIAAFIAHLIATQQGAPQTRQRRRGAPEQAIATYAAAMRESAMTGCTVSLST